ncbi:MAG: cell division protein ZipA C-terminal FtsZ-binding domain-containing protein [Casimicrobiaceae bacterium]
MSSLQIGLIVAGVLLVVGVLAYNGWQERRYRRSVEASGSGDRVFVEPGSGERVEPTLFAQGGGSAAPVTLTTGGESDAELAEEARPAAMRLAARTSAATTPRGAAEAPGPDHEIECIIALQPVEPVPAGALAAGLHARIGKPLRWFGRPDPRSDWQQLGSDTPGRYAEVIACMLLADRNGAASRAQIETFARVIGEIAPTLPAAFVPPDVNREAARAETLDRLCADLDVQIGLTVQKPDAGSIPGTRLRGVAEAAGFHLAAAGRFEFVSEETGAVLYALQNQRPEPFTVESLRLTSTSGVVLLLDVARVGEPARAFDQMKLAAKRMALTLGGDLVDDNRRPLDDAALALIREQVQAAADALRSVHIEPGSARALALFGA